jgi:hypothetical protein
MPVPDEQQNGGSLHAAISDAVVRITADVGIECFQLAPRPDGA